jgi:hypothetical protein
LHGFAAAEIYKNAIDFLNPSSSFGLGTSLVTFFSIYTYHIFQIYAHAGCLACKIEEYYIKFVYAWVLCACRRNTLKARTISAFGNFHGICIYRAINIVLLMGVCWLETLCVYLSQPTRRTSCFCPPHVLK